MKKLLLFIAFPGILAFFQTETEKEFTIEGIIQSETGVPVPNATITYTIKKKSQTIQSEKDGSFELTAPTNCLEITVNKETYIPLKKSVCAAKSNVVTILSNSKVVEDAEEEVLTEATPVVDEVSSIRAREQKERRRKRSLAKPYSGLSMSQINTRNKSIPIGGYPDHRPNFNTEDYDAIQENKFYTVNNEPLSTFSIDVDAASYANMRRFINNGQTPPKDAIRIEEMVNYFDYEYPQPKGDHPFEVITEVGTCPWAPEHKLLHIGLQGKKIPMENLPASNIVFLIDVSGSMSDMNKLPLLQSSFKLLTDQLRPQDKVAIVVYAGAAGLVLPATSGVNKIKIKDAINKLKAGGSTAGGAGIKLAYKVARENFVEGGNNRVIIATDGDFNVGASSDAAMIRLVEEERKSGVFLTVLGFGMGNYKDNKMQKLADTGNGNHAYIDNINEARKVLVSEFGGTLFTIAKDVKIQIEFNPAKVKGYRLIGYENRVLDNEDFNDDKKDAGELGSGHTVTALYEIIPTGVESSFLTNVDPLKYQTKVSADSKANSKEWMTIKLRYKQPAGETSQLLETVVTNYQKDLEKTTENFRWSAAVAEFGMLLRQSEFKSNASYNNAIELANSAKGKDTNGYRMECIKMMKSMRSLVDPYIANKN